MNSLLIHTCNIPGEPVADTKLNFDTGLTTFTVGKTLTGGVSKATGVILSLTKTSGSWALGTAVGYLILNTVSGLFSDNEAITDNGTIPGSAIVNGSPGLNTDEYGVSTYSEVMTNSRCRFKPAGQMRSTASGDRSFSVPSVTLPATVSIQAGVYITSSWSGSLKTYKVLTVHPVSDSRGIHHIRCSLEEVE
jgi:hypothetical protein